MARAVSCDTSVFWGDDSPPVLHCVTAGPSATCVHPTRERGRSYDASRRSTGRVHRHEHAPAAGVEWGYRVEPGSHLARIEAVTHRTGRALVLSHDSGPDPSAIVVRSHGRPV